MPSTNPSELAEQLALATITALNYYPIKSCAGISVTNAELTPRGILHDREFMLVDAATGDFYTQRELPRMALIHPSVAEGRLRVTAPEMEFLDIAIMEAAPETRMARVWKDTCPAVDQGEAAARWFSAFLKVPIRLVRMANDHVRRVNQEYAIAPTDQVGFADGYPLLIISDESLADLNGRLAIPLPMNRFRPNIVIGGSGMPFPEDRLKRFQVGEITLHVVKPCKRCPIPTTDQATAIVGKEPLKTLATYRRWDGGAIFGQNVIHSGPGELRVGQRLTVLATQDGPLP